MKYELPIPAAQGTLWGQMRPCMGNYLAAQSESEVAQSCPTLCHPWTVAYQASPSMGFSRQEYQSELPFPSPGDLPDPGIEPRCPTLQADALPLSYRHKECI